MGNKLDKKITKNGDKNDNNIIKISNRQIAPITDVGYYKKQTTTVDQHNSTDLVLGFVEPWNNKMCKCDNNENDGQICKDCYELYEKRKHTKKCF